MQALTLCAIILEPTEAARLAIEPDPSVSFLPCL
jgi:hypothetical protein